MKPYELIGWTLLQATTVTAITSTRINHGLRPRSDTLPCINYYTTGGDRFDGMERQTFSINCRAKTAGGARDLARTVITAFDGASGPGVYGRNNGFSVARAYLKTDVGLIPEPDDETFNAPVDIDIIYSPGTVS